MLEQESSDAAVVMVVSDEDRELGDVRVAAFEVRDANEVLADERADRSVVAIAGCSKCGYEARRRRAAQAEEAQVQRTVRRCLVQLA